MNSVATICTWLIAALRTHYSVRVHRIELLLTSLALCFVGGGVLFWFHALYRGEAGPQISHGSHWLLDSTLGFVALSPVLAVLLPLAHRLVAAPWLRPLVVGTLFALVTAPGPLVHDALVGGGTTLAEAAVSLFGYQQQSAHGAGHSALSKVLSQLGVGGLVYVLLATAVFFAMPSHLRQLRQRRVAAFPRPCPA